MTYRYARPAPLAGCKFARTLAGTDPVNYALALAEQEELIRRAITAAGYSTAQAQLAAAHFEEAAWDEWQRIVDAG